MERQRLLERIHKFYQREFSLDPIRDSILEFNAKLIDMKVIERRWAQFCEGYDKKVKASEVIQEDVKRIY